MQHEIEHLYEDLTAERYWRAFLLEDSYREQWYGQLKLGIDWIDVNVQGSWPDLRIERRLHVVPDRDLPRPLKKLLRGAALVKEHGVLDVSAGTFTVNIILPVIGRLIDFYGTYRWEQLPSGTLRRTWHCRCDAKIPIVGTRIEKYLLDEMTSSQAQALAFNKRYFSAES